MIRGELGGLYGIVLNPLIGHELAVENPGLDLFDKVATRVLRFALFELGRQLHWVEQREVEFFLGDEVVTKHGPKHGFASLERSFWVFIGVERTRSLDEAGQQCRLRKVEVGDRRAEVLLGRRLNAVGPGAKEDPVQVLGEDEVL